MKIHPRHNKAVAEAGHQMRKVLTEQTIELLKLIGAKIGSDGLFDKLLIMSFDNYKDLWEDIEKWRRRALTIAKEMPY